MRYLLILLCCFVFMGCDDAYHESRSNGNKSLVEYSSGVNVVVVNGCQYIIYQGNNNGDCAMVHAGNCNNQEHLTKK